MRKIPEKIEEVLATPGCPICGLLRLEEFNFMVSLTCECSRSRRVPADLIAHPFCNYHAWEVGKIASHDTWALMLVALLENSSKEGGAKEHALSFPAMESCMICLHNRDREDHWLAQLEICLENPDFRERYRQSSSLCLPHVRAVQPEFRGNARAGDLAEPARQRITELTAKLNETRKRNEFRYMGRGHETLALATQMLFGRRGQMSPPRLSLGQPPRNERMSPQGSMDEA